MSNSTKQSAQSPAPTTVPHEWPGAFSLFKYSESVVKYNLGTLIWLAVISLVVSIILPLFDERFAFPLPTIISYIVSFVLSVASMLVYLAGIERRKVSLEASLKACTPELLLRILACGIVVALLYAVSFLLFIVPFFFVFPRLVLAPYFLIKQKLGPIEAIQASWEASKGHAGKIWGVTLAGLVMVLPFITIVGIPVAVYLVFMYEAAPAIMYYYITANAAEKPASTAAPKAPAA